MPAINFPSSPTNGQVFTDGDHTWVWNSSTGVVGAWKLQTQTVTGPTGPTGPSVTGPTGPTGAYSTTLTVELKTDDYTFTTGDEGKLFRMTSTSAKQFTIPLDSTTNFATGTQFNVMRLNTGSVAITGALGVTVVSALGLILRAQYSIATIIKMTNNTWVVTGDTTS